MDLFSGNDESALRCMQRVVELDPAQSHAWFLLARSKEHTDLDYTADLERAIALNPGLVSAYYYLMRIALKNGDREKAQQYRDQFQRLRQSPLADTVVIPQYQQMGPLSLAEPMPGRPASPLTSGELSPGETFSAFNGIPVACAGGAWADLNGDGHLDLAAFCADPDRPLAIFSGSEGGKLSDPIFPSIGNQTGWTPHAIALGDYDNDDRIDVYLVGETSNVLLRGLEGLTFQNVTASTMTTGDQAPTLAAFFFDADHDSDLDLFLCNQGPNVLLQNNGDGTFSDISASAAIGCGDRESTGMAAADVDQDRDIDLLVFHRTGSPSLLINDRFGEFHASTGVDDILPPAKAGLMQDFSGDGLADIMLAPMPDGSGGGLFLGDGTGGFAQSGQFDGVLESLKSYGAVQAIRMGDWDLDGDWDAAIFAGAVHLLMNDGWGRFVLQPEFCPTPSQESWLASDCIDFNMDGATDIIFFSMAGIQIQPMELTPPGTWLAVVPTGHRGADKRTRSPASGFGTRLEARCGLHTQTLFYNGLNAGTNQSQAPALFGLGGAPQADSLSFVWPDGVTQVEIAMAPGMVHRIMELERKVSSCPVLFCWDGRHFEFITDFAGVGGLGYYVAPGEYAPPQVREEVKIEPHQMKPKDGKLEVRICEPMEEVAYIDRLELRAVDHPAERQVYPDERLAVLGPPPTHRLLYLGDPVFPVAAKAPGGEDCTDRILEVDRKYAYQPILDRRYMGFCAPHSLVLHFDDRVRDLQGDDPVFLMINGWIEYPYSQTTYAASQSQVGWEPMRLELLESDGTWRVLLEDAGAPGGMGRMYTADVTGLIPDRACTLRLTTNLEIYFDQVFLTRDEGISAARVHAVPVEKAATRRLGFPLEYSPDGGHPLLYTYDIIEASSPFKVPSGYYTRYGAVEELIAEFDDQYVIIGSGDELAVTFDASTLPPLPDGWVRSYILTSHAYCKDMDLYTAEGDTIDPLPFAEMSKYPYPEGEETPFDGPLRKVLEQYNTRRVD
jgi:hypothetical protein